MTLRRHDILYLPNLFFFHFLSGFQTVLFNVGRLVIRVCEEIEAAAFLGAFFEVGFHFVSGKGESDVCFSCLGIDFIYLSEAVNEIQVPVIREKAVFKAEGHGAVYRLFVVFVFGDVMQLYYAAFFVNLDHLIEIVGFLAANHDIHSLVVHGKLGFD